MTDPTDPAAARARRKRRPPEAIAAEKARRKVEGERKRAARQEAVRRKQAAQEAEQAGEAKRRDSIRAVIDRRSLAARASDRRGALAAEEAGLKQRRRLQAENARELRRRLAQAGVDPDECVTEQALRHAILVQGRRGAATRMERRGPVHDPRLKIDARLLTAAETLEAWAAEADRLGPTRTALAAWIDNGGVSLPGEGDPDAARARSLAAARRLAEVMARICDRKTLKTPAGDRSRRDALRLCVIEGWPIDALAATEGGKRRQKAKLLLMQALEDLADVIDPPRRAAA